LPHSLFAHPNPVLANGSMGFNVFSFSFSGFDFYITLEAD
jgi:hypothetical protein